MQIARIVVGTAGHTDHGKTSLVKLLTGMDTMRLAEEQARGLTIDMGFANFEMPDGRRVGVIDVPGHERFIRNMVAGASGADVIVLVVAADDGVTQQTRQHVEVLDLLGKKTGLVVLTKTDLVDGEIIELALEEINDLVRGTFLEGAPVVPLSIKTREGFTGFWDALCKTVAAAEVRRDTGPFRMSVQRVFSSKGLGTIITGIPSAGRVRVGDTVEILPSGARGRVRTVQAYHNTVLEGAAGHSTALNISGVSLTDVRRGFTVATPGSYAPTRFVSARLRLSSGVTSISTGDSVSFSIGTCEAPGRVRLMFEENANAGTEPFAQIVLDRPVVAAPGDRFLLRLSSPRVLAAGGVVLSTDCGKRKRGKPNILDELLKRQAYLGNAEATAELVLSLQKKPMRESALLINTGFEPGDVTQIVHNLAAAGKVFSDHAKGSVLHRKAAERMAERIADMLDKYFEKFPVRLGIPVAELRSRLNADRWHIDCAIELLIADGRIKLQNGILIPAGSTSPIPVQFKALIMEIEDFVKEKGIRGAREKSLLTRFNGNGNTAELVRHLTDAGKIIRTRGVDKHILLFHAGVVEDARIAVIECCRKNGQVLFVDLKAALGFSFNKAVSIMEHLRKTGLVRRKDKVDVLADGT